MKRPRVLLADDHTLLLEGLRKLLETEYELVGTAEDGRTLLALAPTVQPDVILLDISMPLLNGLEAARRLKQLLPETKLVFLTMHADPTYAREAFLAGASGYVLKRSGASELIEAIRRVLRGERYLTPLAAAPHAPEGVPGPPQRPAARAEHLTPRQREVLQLVAEGRATKEIASILDVSIKTVEFHKSRIMDELGLRTVAELTRYAIAHGLVGP